MAKLHFYYAAMNAGKSTLLLQSNHNYLERGMDTLLYTPSIDHRFGVGKIATRLGIQADALAFDQHFDLFEHTKQSIITNPNIACVLIDEAQFLTKKQVRECCRIADELNKPVLTYGLRSDFMGELFEGSLYLLAWSDILIELKTICHCGKKATMNLRIDEQGEAIREGEQIFIGGNESFVATCRKHYYLGQGKSDKERLRLQMKSIAHEEVNLC
jgi:thymidine kinase